MSTDGKKKPEAAAGLTNGDKKLAGKSQRLTMSKLKMH